MTACIIPPNDPENGFAGVVRRNLTVIHGRRQQEIVDIPLFSGRILPAGAGILSEINWAIIVSFPSATVRDHYGRLPFEIETPEPYPSKKLMKQ